jgi:hypothetical protein
MIGVRYGVVTICSMGSQPQGGLSAAQGLQPVGHRWGVFGIFSYFRHFCVRCPSDHEIQARMGRGIHGLPKVSPGLAMPDPSTPCGWASPQTALWPFGGWPARRADGRAAVFYPLGYPFPYGPDEIHLSVGVSFVQRSRHVSLVVSRFHQHVDKVFVGIFYKWIP